jgi:ABC-type proline/glycine betaine transport system permease subunit
VGSLVYGCSLLVRETRLALDQIDEEVSDAVSDSRSKGDHT